MIDLHIHSTASDGTYTPTEIAQLAKKKGITTFALTDHDTIGGVEEAYPEARALGVTMIPGMEITCSYVGRKLHIVALGFDAYHPAFRRMYQTIRTNRERGMDDLIRGIREKGVDITREKVQAVADGPLDRYAVMQYLVSLHICDRVQPLWDDYIDPVLAAIGVSNIRARDAIRAVHEAGGITSLAHFHKKIGLKGFSREVQAELIAGLHQEGLDAMEHWYPSYTEDDKAFVSKISKRLGLLATGGTDFHGGNRNEVEIGTGTDHNMEVIERIMTPLYDRMEEYRARSGMARYTE